MKQPWLNEGKIREPQTNTYTNMADYYAQTRSNYFKVKDEAAFREWAESRELKVWQRDEGERGYFAIHSTDVDEKGWHRADYDEEMEDFREVDFEPELSEHLQDGSVAVLMEVGAESLRYLNGIATAVNSKGETESVDLRDIYGVAEHLGGEITRAEW